MPDGTFVRAREISNPKQVQLPPGIEFARLAICKAAARLIGSTPMEVARERYPDNQRIQNYLKAATTGAATTGTWGGQLLEDTLTLPGEFLEYLRPQTIVGRFGTGGIPGLRRIPFN